MSASDKYLLEAVRLAREGMESREGGPFGCVVVKDGRIVGKSSNRVFATNDPTAHAEILAIREAGKNLGTADLTGCEIYSSGEPCPMCMAAIYWARIDSVYYANSKEDAALQGFDDSAIYKELRLPNSERAIRIKRLDSEEAGDLFRDWNKFIDKEDLPQTEAEL